MAEMLLKSKLKEAGVNDIWVKSAGLNAENGTKISKNSALALKKKGLKSYSFRSRKITEKMIKSSVMVICMTESHKQALSGYDGVYTVKELTGLPSIPDPYGMGLEVYTETMLMLDKACDVLVDKILKAKGENV